MLSSTWLRRRLAAISAVAIAIVSLLRKSLAVALRNFATDVAPFARNGVVAVSRLVERLKVKTKESVSTSKKRRSRWYSVTREILAVVSIAGSAIAALIVGFIFLYLYSVPSPPTPKVPDHYTFSVATQNYYVYLWIPQAVDLSTNNESQASNALRFLLAHSNSIRYNVLPGETVDEIIRTRLFVYQRGFPNAYAIYSEEIHRRNPDLRDFCGISAGDVLVLPEGPKFAAVKTSTSPAEIPQKSLPGMYWFCRRVLNLLPSIIPRTRRKRIGERW